MPKISHILALPAEGGCCCGRMRFRITVAPLLAMACHCRGCQSMTGSAHPQTLRWVSCIPGSSHSLGAINVAGDYPHPIG